MSDLREAVADVLCTKAIKLLNKQADKYMPKDRAYTVTNCMRTDVEPEEDPSMNEYCETCIQHAIAEFRSNYFKERRELMGRLYELNKYGYTLDVKSVYSDDGKFIRQHISKSAGRNSKDQAMAISQLERQLKKLSPRRKFGYRYYECCFTEKDNFEHCDTCGETFCYGVIVSDQEVEHYESLDAKDLRDSVKDDPQAAYELRRIIESADNSDLKLRIGAIAGRLVSKKPMTT